MKRRIKSKNIFLSIFFLAFSSIYAQQDAMFSHFSYTSLYINPAIAAMNETANINVINRSQWMGFEGAPTSQMITVNSLLKNQNIGLGGSFFKEKIGSINSSSINGDIAYRKNFREGFLSFGLKGGLKMLNNDLSSLKLNQSNDETFQESIVGKTVPNIGIGCMYQNEKYYVGCSVPNLFHNYTQVSDMSNILMLQQRHYYLLAGVEKILTDKVVSKSNTIIKYTKNAPFQIDLNSIIEYNKTVSFGVLYRTGDAFAALVGLNLNKQIFISYSYDWSFKNRTFKYNTGSHEILLQYHFLKRISKIRSSRYL